MLKLLKNLTKKEWLYAIFCVILIVGQVWLELKIPDYMSEITVLISAQHFVTKYTKVSFPYMKLAKEIVRYIPLLLFYWVISQYIDSNLIINFGIGTIITGIYVFVVKRKFITEIIKLRK